MPNSLQLKALGMEGMINELLRYLRLAENPLSSAYSFLAAPIYNIILHSLVEAREVSVLNHSFFSCVLWFTMSIFILFPSLLDSHGSRNFQRYEIMWNTFRCWNLQYHDPLLQYHKLFQICFFLCFIDDSWWFLSWDSNLHHSHQGTQVSILTYDFWFQDLPIRKVTMRWSEFDK